MDNGEINKDMAKKERRQGTKIAYDSFVLMKASSPNARRYGASKKHGKNDKEQQWNKGGTTLWQHGSPVEVTSVSITGLSYPQDGQWCITDEDMVVPFQILEHRIALGCTANSTRLYVQLNHLNDVVIFSTMREKIR